MEETMETKKQLHRKIAILFLAHAGITQPAWWTQWITETSVGKSILLYVATQDKKLVPPSNEAVTWHWVPLSYATHWCDISQVMALQDGLGKILKDDKKGEVSCVYFISGAEVPVIAAKQLYEEPDVTRIVVSIHDDMASRLQEFSGKDYTKLRPFLTAIHAAALSLDRRDAERIANFPRDELMKLNQVLHQNPTAVWT